MRHTQIKCGKGDVSGPLGWGAWPSPCAPAPSGRLAPSSSPHGFPNLLRFMEACIPQGCWPLMPFSACSRLVGLCCVLSPSPQPPLLLPTSSFHLKGLPPLPICSPSPFPVPGHPWVPSPAMAGAEEGPPHGCLPSLPKYFELPPPPP